MLGAIKHFIVFLATGFKCISRRRSDKQFHAFFLVMPACNIEFLLHWVLLTTEYNFNLSIMFWILFECTTHLYSALHVLPHNGYELMAKPHRFLFRKRKQVWKKKIWTSFWVLITHLFAYFKLKMKLIQSNII